MTNQICNHCINNANSIFYSLGEEEKIILSQKHTCLKFGKDEIIYREGEKPDGLICLSSGKVKIYKEGIGGREQIVRMARPVGFIGYRALFAEENYMATSVALEESVICIINRDALFRVLETNSELSLKIIRSFATELGFSNSRTVTLTQKHIRGRLAESLIFLKDTYGLENDNETIKVYLSREDIANLSNMTTSNAIRTLSNFAAENVIAIDGRKIKIRDLDQLEKISEHG